MHRRVFLRQAATVAALLGVRAQAQSLRFDAGQDFAAWQQELRARLRDVLNLREQPLIPLDPAVEPAVTRGDHSLQRIRFTAEAGETVPGYLLRPQGVSGPLPLMICLQGHSPGMHLSIGEARNEAEEKAIAGGRDLALQAVRQGWAALAIEQRGFGLRQTPGVRCNDAALHSLHQGRPLTGQRVFDVMRAIDFAATQPDLDPKRIACIGNSTGGTVSFYAACVDARIRLAVVSCSFCTYAESWLSRPHCACGYLPGIMQVADMPDLAGLIAPNRLLIVAGRTDPLASIEGVEQGFARTRDLFTSAGCPDRVRLVIGEGGHQFFPDLAWRVIREWMPT